VSDFDADKALETARDSVSGFGFDLPEDKFALTTENVELRTRLEKAEKERDELKEALAQAEHNQREVEIDLEVLVELVPQEYLDEAREERGRVDE